MGNPRPDPLQGRALSPDLNEVDGARHGGPRSDGGSAAVEFALIVPILLLLLFGIVDYGLLFSNSLAVKQGVREAARQGVVGNFGPSCPMDFSEPPTPNIRRLACTVLDRTGVVVGERYVKIDLPNGWVKGEPVVVCELVESGGLTGLTPMPDGGLVTSKVEMSIEKAAAGQVETGGEQALPPGASWSWC